MLTEKQLSEGYFENIGGFPPAKIVHTSDEYDGSENCCIACTQLPYGYSDSERRRILKDWIHFLKNNPKTFRALHFNSHVPQRLFDAACCQENLVELRTKWGNYADLSGLAQLQELRYLCLGSFPGVMDLSHIAQKTELIVLYLENTKRILDYSPLQKLQKLQQLTISGPTLGNIYMADIDFLLNMPNLRSVWFPNTRYLKKYSQEEKERLRMTSIRGVYNQEWWKA